MGRRCESRRSSTSGSNPQPWDKLVWESWHVTMSEPLLFGGSLTSCHSVLMASTKTERMHFHRLWGHALLSICLAMVCEISLCTSFQTFLRRDFVAALYLISSFATKKIGYTPCYTHNQIFSFGRSWGTFGVLTPATFGVNIYNSTSGSGLSVVATAVGEWLWVYRVFLAQMEVPSF